MFFYMIWPFYISSSPNPRNSHFFSVQSYAEGYILSFAEGRGVKERHSPKHPICNFLNPC